MALGGTASRDGRLARMIVLDILIVLLTVVAWVMMVLGVGEERGVLSSMGLGSLKYFTVQSNLLSELACLVDAIWILRTKGRVEVAPGWLEGLRCAATTAVMVTMLTTFLFLVSIYGLIPLLRGANLLFHLVLPLMAVAGFCIVDPRRPPTRRVAMAGALPTLIYGLGYYANILVNGVGEWPNTNDWYGFARWGVDKAPIALLVMVLLSLLIALGLVALGRVCRGHKTR